MAASIDNLLLVANLAIYAMNKLARIGPKSVMCSTRPKFLGTMAVINYSPENHHGTGPEAQILGQFKDRKFFGAAPMTEDRHPVITRAAAYDR